MGSKRFELDVTLRVAFLALSAMLLGVLLVGTDYRATTLLLGLAILAQVGGLLRRVTATNRELARFLTAIAHSDFSQTFAQRGRGGGFDELGEAFTAVAERFRATRADTEKQADYLNAVLEHVPVALAEVWPDGRVRLLNNAGRRLLGPEDLTRRSADGRSLAEALRELKPGARQLLRVAPGQHGGALQLTVAATQLTLAGEPRLLVSLQNIGADLDATEVRAWQDLVRVLTHEMMNSLTPVASLTRTARAMLEDLRDRVADRPDLREEVADAEQAIDTVARRSDGLLRFVERYRQFTAVPRPQLQRLRLREMVERLQRLMGPALAEKGIVFEVLILPPTLELLADADLVEQTLINLMKNAVEAMQGQPEPRLRLTAHLDETGRVLVTVADTGPGIPPEIADKIFVPFFTTKREGSGVGLSLARQVMLAHGGSISAAAAEGGGSAFTLRF
ncbi:sensor histidine kinase [Oleisolibacter albus]|uniref:sensor histidine kinase n=1 Tax=Oleisolibacter albus TaxID=2171757 RepID=UPI000DF22B0B|nr:ATP-binding protein [Oleisolibacter albus]